jgi:hypothetical protein
LTVKLAPGEERCPGCRLLARNGYYTGAAPAAVANPSGGAGEAKTDDRHAADVTLSLLKSEILRAMSG